MEIISFKSKSLNLNQSNFNIAIREESKLESHRSLFQSYLKQNKGVIVHIGNPKFKDDTECGFWASDIIDWDFESYILELPNFEDGETGSNQTSNFKILIEHKNEIKKLIDISIESSPIKEASFLTDYQFGSENANFIEISVSNFWSNHDKNGLKWNTMYKFKG